MRTELQLRTARIGSERRPGEGLRIGTVRRVPRGIRKCDRSRLNYFDVWLPTLAPNEELLSAWNGKKLTLDQFFRHYRKEMQETDPRQVIATLAKIAEQTPITICCYCEDESRCHRSVLYSLIREAAGLGNVS